jgi:hypothetical protein
MKNVCFLVLFIPAMAVNINKFGVERSREIENAVEKFIFNFHQQASLDVHIEIRTNSVDVNFMLKNLMKHSINSAICVASRGRQIRRYQIVVILIEKFSSTQDFDIIENNSDFYLIVSAQNGSQNDEEKIFSFLWTEKNILNVNYLKVSGSGDVIDLITFFPFTEKSCNNTRDIAVINQFVNAQWIGAYFYPDKLRNFHNCSLRLGAAPAAPASMRKIHIDGTVEYHGSDIEITEELSKRLNFVNNVSFYANWGELFENGTGTFMSGDLAKRNIDYMCGWNFLAQVKGLFMDFTQPYFFVPFVVVVPPGNL